MWRRRGKILDFVGLASIGQGRHGLDWLRWSRNNVAWGNKVAQACRAYDAARSVGKPLTTAATSVWY